MKFTALIIAIGLLTVSIFGFAAMSHGTVGCDSLAASMTSGDCPQALMSMAVHHISAYTSFSEVTISYATAVFLSILLLAVVVAYILRRDFILDPPLVFSGVHTRVRDSLYYSGARYKTHRWLSLFENSPSLF